ncbi:Kelch repeat type 1 [Trinorchestia longiramus]|nr:Kelch repeat type 1 [Trinorchestia longiramus]
MARIINPLWCSHFTHLLFQEVLASNVVFSQVLNNHRKRVGDSECNADPQQQEIPTNETFSGGDFTDLTLRLAEGDLKVHKTFFVKVSSYFKCMLNSKCREQCSSVVCLPGIDVLPMMLTVQYIYTGSVDLTTDTLLDVMALADYFNIASLTKLCTYFARSSMCPESCVPVYCAAMTYDYRALARFALSYAARHAYLLLSDVQMYLLTATADCLQALFNHPLLPIGNGVSVFQIVEAVKEWADHDPSTRYRDVTKILTASQLCCLLNHHPQLRKVLVYHPDSTLPLHVLQCFDHARIRNKMEMVQVLFVLGGEECGRLSKTLECCHVKRSSMPTAPQWSFLYSICDVKKSLCERNLDAELSALRYYRPCSAGDAAVNLSSCAPQRVSFEVSDPKLSKLLDDAYNDHVSVLHQQAAEGQSSSRLPSKSVITHTIEAWGARQYAAVVSVEDSNTFVVMGGLGNWGLPLSSVIQFWPEKNSWLVLPDLPAAVYGCCAAVVDDAIYCVGGASKLGYSNAIHRLNPECTAWEQLPLLPGPGLCHAAAVVLNDALYVLGGLIKTDSRAHYTDVCWKFEPASREWTQIASMPVKRAYHGAAVIGEQLYAIGGYTGCYWLSCVQRYCPLTDTWTSVQNMLTARSSFAVTVSDSGIHVMGGFTGHRPSNEVRGVLPVTVCQVYFLSLCVRCTSCDRVSGVLPVTVCQVYFL